MSFVIVVQDPNNIPDTLIGPFTDVEAAKEYIATHELDFDVLVTTIAEEYEGKGDVPPVQAFIAYMNLPRRSVEN